MVGLNPAQFGQPLTLQQRDPVDFATLQHHLLKQEKERGLMQDWLQNSKLAKHPEERFRVQ